MDSFWLGVLLVISGCCISNLFLENLLCADRGAGQLLTLLQFAFVAALSVHNRFEWRSSRVTLRPLSVPILWYALLTAVFWTLSVLNGMAYDYNISIAFHMVFRSSSLAISLLLGATVFGKRYERTQVIGVILVTLGILIATAADAKPMGSSIGSWGVGLACMSLALFLSSLLGHLQTWGFERWKSKDVDEAMFFQHFLSLFLFAPMSSTLSAHIPHGYAAWLGVLCNLFTQYLCIRGVYLLISTSGPVTATLVLTCRKFISLLLSIALFHTPWTVAHWLGSGLVFGGALVYSIKTSGGPQPWTPRH